MENNHLIEKIKKLSELEDKINSDNMDTKLIDEMNDIVKNLSEDFNNEILKKTNTLNVKIKKLVNTAVIPKYAKNGDAGIDLTATSILSDTEKQIIFSCGLALEIPYGYVGLIFPRSSIRNKELLLSNSVGVIDSGYRGDIQVTFNKTNGLNSLTYNVGERIAQIMIIPHPNINFIEVDDLSDSERASGGHGSTGV